MKLLPRRPRVTFLTWNVYGKDGIARIVVNVANELVKTHDVEILSVKRRSRKTTFPVDPRVEVVPIFDLTAAAKQWRADHPKHPNVKDANREPQERHLRREGYNGLMLRRLRARLGSTESDVVISTRPTLHWVSTRMTRSHVGRIGWDHLNFETRYASVWVGPLLDETIPDLDAWVTLTEGDEHDYRARLGSRIKRSRTMRNSSGWVAPEGRPPRDQKVVVAGGRLHERKGFDRAIEAWQPLAVSHPDWQLHIYGSGPERETLEELIASSGLERHVVLKGYARDFRSILAGAEAFLMTSRAEGFPMVLVEAMSQGTPIVSMDCPRGPAEIVSTWRNGVLVDDGDTEGVSSALSTLFDDDALRARLGNQAMADSREYEIERIADHWRDLIAEVAREGRHRRAARRVVATARRRWPGRG
jgi:glycosyltransferase involved in cell wall biosynthesis